MGAKWCRPGTSGGGGEWRPRHLCGFTPKGQPVWGPSLENVGEDDTYGWRTKKLKKSMNRRDMYFAVTGRESTGSCKGLRGQRAARRTRARFLNYKLRNHEPRGYEPTTGEALFDHGSCLNQSSDCDNRRKTHFALSFVMPYSRLTDVLFTNSMEMGRSKTRGGSGTRKDESSCEKPVILEPRPSEEWEKTWEGKKAGERVVKRARCESPTPTDDDDWGEWKCWSKLRRMK